MLVFSRLIPASASSSNQSFFEPETVACDIRFRSSNSPKGVKMFRVKEQFPLNPTTIPCAWFVPGLKSFLILTGERERRSKEPFARERTYIYVCLFVLLHKFEFLVMWQKRGMKWVEWTGSPGGRTPAKRIINGLRGFKGSIHFVMASHLCHSFELCDVVDCLSLSAKAKSLICEKGGKFTYINRCCGALNRILSSDYHYYVKRVKEWKEKWKEKWNV